jgi:hypothetical protein
MLRPRAYPVVVLLVVEVLGLCGAAKASPPQPVAISVLTVFADSSDPFTSTGGVVCASGTVSTSFLRLVGQQRGGQAQILVGKHFVCSDGTFDLLLHVTVYFLYFDTGDTLGGWSVVRGTGAYARLHGTGTITGTTVVPGTSIDDEYTGAMHID